MPNSKGETVRTAIVTFLLLLAISAMVWHLSGRLAHGAPSAEWGPISPEVRAWAKQQHNGRGEWWFRNISGVHRDYCFAPGTLS